MARPRSLASTVSTVAGFALIASGLAVGGWYVLDIVSSNTAAAANTEAVAESLRADWDAETDAIVLDDAIGYDDSGNSEPVSVTGVEGPRDSTPLPAEASDAPNEKVGEPSPAAKSASPAETAVSTPPMEPLKAAGFLYVPRLSDRVWGTPIVVGVDDRALASGIGMLPDAPKPGRDGVAVLAGHRATDGEPFADFPDLTAGDTVIVEGKKDYLVYRVDKKWRLKDGEPLVVPAARSEKGSDIILVTCHPRWGHGERLLAQASLIEVHKKGSGWKPQKSAR